MGGYLFEPKDYITNDEVLAQHGSYNYWIGIHRDNTDIYSYNRDNFSYLKSGLDIIWDNWAVNEPNENYTDASKEQCVVVEKAGKWNDVPCSSIHISVCELPLIK